MFTRFIRCLREAYHGNWPGIEFVPPMIRAPMEMPQFSWFTKFSFSGGNFEACDGNVGVSTAAFDRLGNTMLGSVSTLFKSKPIECEFVCECVVRIGGIVARSLLFGMFGIFLIGLTCWKCVGILKSSENDGGQLRYEWFGSSKSKKWIFRGYKFLLGYGFWVIALKSFGRGKWILFHAFVLLDPPIRLNRLVDCWSNGFDSAFLSIETSQIHGFSLVISRKLRGKMSIADGGGGGGQQMYGSLPMKPHAFFRMSFIILVVSGFGALRILNVIVVQSFSLIQSHDDRW